MFGLFKKKAPPAQFPPVPKWQPAFAAPLDDIVGRMRYYINDKRDFAVLKHGTCVVLPHGMADAEAHKYAAEVLHNIFHAHPDMNPMQMDDGNVLVQYNHPAVNIVIAPFARTHWDEIEQRHQDALATSEVLITPLGSNRFDDTGKLALYGRCFMFMDAQAPEVVRIERAGAPG